VNPQPEAAIEAVRDYIAHLDAWQLAAFDTATATTKSCVIALALAEGHMTALEATAAARLEEDFQTELYGFVEGGHDWDVASTKIRLLSAEIIFRSLEMDKEEPAAFSCLMEALEAGGKVQ